MIFFNNKIKMKQNRLIFFLFWREDGEGEWEGNSKFKEFKLVFVAFELHYTQSLYMNVY